MTADVHGGDTIIGVPTLGAITTAIAAQLELVADLGTCYVEIAAEHHNEVALYGDSWPGAATQISDAGSALRRAEETLWDLLTTRDALYPYIGPTYTAHDTEDEPF